MNKKITPKKRMAALRPLRFLKSIPVFWRFFRRRDEQQASQRIAQECLARLRMERPYLFMTRQEKEEKLRVLRLEIKEAQRKEVPARWAARAAKRAQEKTD